jgi:hypothetical protein
MFRETGRNKILSREIPFAVEDTNNKKKTGQRSFLTCSKAYTMLVSLFNRNQPDDNPFQRD